MPNTTLQAGFKEPVLQAQEGFRALLKAMSEPATRVTLGLSQGLQGLTPATYDVLLSLCDSDTQLWISPALDNAVVRQNLAFHCACPITEDLSQADFALMLPSDIEGITQLNNGTDRDPELSCTAIIQVASLSADTADVPATQWRGPGLEKPVRVALEVPSQLWTIREQVNQFPRGIDMVFCDQDQVMALPRSTHVVFVKD